MKRLTKYFCNAAHGAEGVNEDKLTGSYCRGEFEATSIVERLAKIEDILGGEYDLERLRELVEADKQGRCEILPQKKIFSMLGSDVYVVNDGGVLNALLCFIGYTPDGIGCIEAVYNPCFEDEKGFVFKFSDVGEKLFLTKEAAEAALAKENEK